MMARMKVFLAVFRSVAGFSWIRLAILSGIALPLPLGAQTTAPWTLEQVIAQAQAQAIAAKQATARRATAEWRWRAFQADYRPQLVLEGNLPSFTRSFIEVRQPDGNLAFNAVSFNNAQLNLTLRQRLSKTGGTIFLQQQLQRFDDFEQGSTLYNGIPLAVGWEQPLRGYNAFKWEKQVEPLRYTESQQAYTEQLEDIAFDATQRYFDLLLAQVNLQIATNNRQNSDTLLVVAQEKLALGKLSQNDLLQLQLGRLTALKDLSAARQAAAVAALELRTFLGLRQAATPELELPLPQPTGNISPEVALREARRNRSAATAFQRRALVAASQLDQARTENGFTANLVVAVGLSNRGEQLRDLVRQPLDRQYVALQFNLPLVDWGRARARVATAEANLQVEQQEIAQDELNFEQAILTQVTLVGMLLEQAQLTAQADALAAERFAIAQQRFLLSDLSITDLSIAIQEKDQARRDHIQTLRSFWEAHYTLRRLTLYDFARQQKIIY